MTGRRFAQLLVVLVVLGCTATPTAAALHVAARTAVSYVYDTSFENAPPRAPLFLTTGAGDSERTARSVSTRQAQTSSLALVVAAETAGSGVRFIAGRNAGRFQIPLGAFE